MPATKRRATSWGGAIPLQGNSGGVAHLWRALVEDANLRPKVTASEKHMIWDLHAHFERPEPRTSATGVERLLRYADRMGIERIVTFMGSPFRQDPTPAELRENNDATMRAVAAHPDRVFGLAYLSGNHVPESLAQIERCIADGPLVGIKLWVARRCNDPAMAPLFERAAALDALIFQHTWIKAEGNLAGESTPMDLVEVARRHPQTPMICGHAGGDWELGIRAVRTTPNLYIETAGFDPEAGMVEMAVRELGARRVIYGSDAPGRSYASQLAKVHGARVDQAAKRLIFKDNLRRLMLPILSRKGFAA